MADEEYVLSGDARLYDAEADQAVIGWRVSCFLELGFGPLYAEAVAIRRDIDREEVERLIKAGATPTQVQDIVL